MKSILGFLFLLLLVLFTGGLYLRVRPADKQASDWQRLKNVPTAIGNYFRQLFTTHAVVDDAPVAPAV